MSSNKTIKNIFNVTLSNLIKLFAGVLVGFLLPKIISIDDYGYYKTFALYATYVGLFHFGFLDGIYLKFGGYDYNQLDKNKFRFYSRYLIILEFIISLLGCLVSITFLSGNLKIIFIFVSVFLFTYNVTGYYQYISQITGRFNELSIINIIQSVLTALSIILLWILNYLKVISINYVLYLYVYVGIQMVLCTWYIFTYKKITFGQTNNCDNKFREIVDLSLSGFPLLVSNLCLLLILSIDRQFVNIIFNNQVYAKYAFAYNLMSLISTVSSAIAIVIYPSMKRMNIDLLKKAISKFVIFTSVFVFMCLLVYYPLCLFIDWFLPKYSESLIIFRIILPGICISSLITIVYQNYFKILYKNFIFFVISIIILALSFAANLISYLIFKTTISISIVSIIVMILWYIIILITLKKQFDFKILKDMLYLIIMIISFYMLTFINNYYIGFFVHVAVFSIITVIFYYKYIILGIKKISSKKKGIYLENDIISQNENEIEGEK